MVDKRKKRVRDLSSKTGMRYQAAANIIDKETPKSWTSDEAFAEAGKLATAPKEALSPGVLVYFLCSSPEEVERERKKCLGYFIAQNLLDEYEGSLYLANGGCVIFKLMPRGWGEVYPPESASLTFKSNAKGNPSTWIKYSTMEEAIRQAETAGEWDSKEPLVVHSMAEAQVRGNKGEYITYSEEALKEYHASLEKDALDHFNKRAEVEKKFKRLQGSTLHHNRAQLIVAFRNALDTCIEKELEDFKDTPFKIEVELRLKLDTGLEILYKPDLFLEAKPTSIA